ncbi:hypothetical protein JG687_00011169 [Phytophthora cactorum]|uniref:HAT C-terminal dimerisation domain-containing protein n=1 Tax=Phytophthora cactorum TaxID=29920 RepID=A0A8T1U599_9STRA|nr:hypothetical protein JG687_00011169 [Phytophthora cactorum]
MALPDGKRVWNVEGLCQYINIRQWFLDTGEGSFLTIALLARVWLGRCSSTAFQERVFSTGSFLMSPLRTRTDNESAHRQLILHHNTNEIERLKESSQRLVGHRIVLLAATVSISTIRRLKISTICTVWAPLGHGLGIPYYHGWDQSSRPVGCSNGDHLENSKWFARNILFDAVSP